MTLTTVCSSALKLVDEISQIFDREISASTLLNSETREVFIRLREILCAPINDASTFAKCVHVLTRVNSCAALCEQYASNDPVSASYWLHHAYELRTRSELVGTHLLHSVENVPQFEESLAKLRISCGHLAKKTGNSKSARIYIQGALRLAASDSTVSVAKKVMQTH